MRENKRRQLLGVNSNTTSVLPKKKSSKKKEKGRKTQHHLLAGRRYWCFTNKCNSSSITQSVDTSSGISLEISRQNRSTCSKGLLLDVWVIRGCLNLPQHHTQTSGCPSCGDTWASLQVHWGGKHPDRGHLSGFLCPLCTRTPGINKMDRIDGFYDRININVFLVVFSDCSGMWKKLRGSFLQDLIL